MNKANVTLKIDATYGLKIKPGDKICKGENILENRQEIFSSPVSGKIKSTRFNPDNHEFQVVISPVG